jgi:putative endonuclease
MFVYILASKSRVLYVGVTADLLRRMWEHRTGALPGFTRRYGVNQLVYYEATDDPAGAIRRENHIKGWARVKKVAMIESTNPEWSDLAERWFVDVSSDDPSPPLGVTREAARPDRPILLVDDSSGDPSQSLGMTRGSPPPARLSARLDGFSAMHNNAV